MNVKSFSPYVQMLCMNSKEITQLRLITTKQSRNILRHLDKSIWTFLFSVLLIGGVCPGKFR